MTARGAAYTIATDFARVTMSMPRRHNLDRRVLAFCLALSAAAVAADGTRSVMDGVFTEAQAERGEALYGTHCVECHGEDLRGAHMTPSMVGIGFAFRWRNRDLYDFYEGMQTTMPQSAPGGLSADVYADLVAFILARNGYPVGDVELSSEPAELRGIVIEAEF